MMTLPLTFIVITGEIDLSVASTLGLSSALVGYLWAHGWPMSAIIPTVLVVGVVTGRVQRPAGHTGRAAVARGHHRDAHALPRDRGRSSSGRTRSRTSRPGTRTSGSTRFRTPFLSYSVLIFLILAVVFGVVLHFTPFGRSLFAIGRQPGGRDLRRHPREADQDCCCSSCRASSARAPGSSTPSGSRRPSRTTASGSSSASSPSCCSAASRSSAVRLDRRRRARRLRLRRPAERALPDELPGARPRDRHRRSAARERPRPERVVVRPAGTRAREAARGARPGGCSLASALSAHLQ